MRYEVDGAVWQAAPEICFGVVAAVDIHPLDGAQAWSQRLEEAVVRNAARRTERIKDDPAVVPYRDLVRTLGMNPNRYPPSLEALLTRIVKGKGLPSVSPLVDAVNVVSLTCDVPIGAHDAATLTDGVLIVRPAREGDTFIPFGSSAAEHPDTGEIVYASAASVRTRRFIWRQSECGKITDTTTRALFPIDGAVGTRARVEAAVRMLGDILATDFGAQVRCGLLTATTPVWEWADER